MKSKKRTVSILVLVVLFCSFALSAFAMKSYQNCWNYASDCGNSLHTSSWGSEQYNTKEKCSNVANCVVTYTWRQVIWKCSKCGYGNVDFDYYLYKTTHSKNCK